MGVVAGLGRPADAAAPQPRDLIDQRRHRPRIGVGRPEIPCLGDAGITPQPLGQKQVAGERLEHVLPGSHRVWVADFDRAARGKRAYAVGHQAVLCPIAAADHVASARRRHRRRAVARECLAVGGGDQLGARLAGAVGIAAAERIGLAVGNTAAALEVTFVARHVQDHAHAVEPASRLQHMRRAEHVGREGADRISVGPAHERLCSEVKDDLRPRGAEHAAHRNEITHVAERRCDAFVEAALGEQAGLGIGDQSQPGHRGPEPRQPVGKPAALEAGVAGDQNPLAAPERGRRIHQTFHGALPDCHSVSSITLSRRVSIGCQKPV